MAPSCEVGLRWNKSENGLLPTDWECLPWEIGAQTMPELDICAAKMHPWWRWGSWKKLTLTKVDWEGRYISEPGGRQALVHPTYAIHLGNVNTSMKHIAVHCCPSWLSLQNLDLHLGLELHGQTHFKWFVRGWKLKNGIKNEHFCDSSLN